MTEWQPIETAPEGTEILIFDNGDVTKAVLKFTGGELWWALYCTQPTILQPEPTHWMPLPTPPEMSDDLVKRDREELEAERDALAEKLAKAVEALQVFANDGNWFDTPDGDGVTMNPTWRGPTFTPEQFARDVIAELTGGDKAMMHDLSEVGIRKSYVDRIKELEAENARLQAEKAQWVLAQYDDGELISLSSYSGGAAEGGAWSGLTLMRTDENGAVTFRKYKAVTDWLSDPAELTGGEK